MDQISSGRTNSQKWPWNTATSQDSSSPLLIALQITRSWKATFTRWAWSIWIKSAWDTTRINSAFPLPLLPHRLRLLLLFLLRMIKARLLKLLPNRSHKRPSPNTINSIVLISQSMLPKFLTMAITARVATADTAAIDNDNDSNRTAYLNPIDFC